jgi:hypothetical protein
MHSSQIYTAGPATSRSTSAAVPPQNEQRSPDFDLNHRVIPASLVDLRIVLYPRFAPLNSPAQDSAIAFAEPRPRSAATCFPASACFQT